MISTNTRYNITKLEQAGCFMALRFSFLLVANHAGPLNRYIDHPFTSSLARLFDWPWMPLLGSAWLWKVLFLGFSAVWGNCQGREDYPDSCPAVGGFLVEPSPACPARTNITTVSKGIIKTQADFNSLKKYHTHHFISTNSPTRLNLHWIIHIDKLPYHINDSYLCKICVINTHEWILNFHRHFTKKYKYLVHGNMAV